MPRWKQSQSTCQNVPLPHILASISSPESIPPAFFEPCSTVKFPRCLLQWQWRGEGRDFSYTVAASFLSRQPPRACLWGGALQGFSCPSSSHIVRQAGTPAPLAGVGSVLCFTSFHFPKLPWFILKIKYFCSLLCTSRYLLHKGNMNDCHYHSCPPQVEVSSRFFSTMNTCQGPGRRFAEMCDPWGVSAPNPHLPLRIG